ncbi:MAG TPA: DUF222 domain-containing protein [Trebonia sp.]
MTQHPFPGPGQDGDEPVPGDPARDDADDVGERYLDWLAAEIEAGREQPPPEEPPPAVTVSLGEAGDIGLDELARMAEGLSGTGFAQDQAADVLPPGPVLGALTSQAVEDMASLGDDELLGVILAARRLQARDEYLELAAVAEYNRRSEEAYEASKARGDKPRHRDGEFAAEELGAELNCSHYAAGKRMELADDLSSRLSCTFAGMAAGTIDGYKAKIIHEAGPADASHEDQPPAEDRDDDASFPDDGDGDDTGEHDDDRRDGDDSRFPDNGYDGDDGEPGDEPTPGRPGGPVGKAPLPALTNITVSAGTLLGWSDTPAEVAGFGLITPDDARDLVAAAGLHPRSRWCVTVLGEDGEAIAHGCASGRHPWTPASPRDGTARAGPDDNQRAQLTALLRQLGIDLAPIAKGECDHRHREERYRPSRKLRHLIHARTATCPAPGCNAQATHNEIDHTIPWPAGETDECDLSPPCSRHHHAKHAPGWKLEQPEPGVMRWTLPSGRSHTTRPTRYDE